MGVVVLVGGLSWLAASRADRKGPPVASVTITATRILAFGDSGDGSAAQRKIAELMDREQFDAIVHTGDIAYPRGSATDIDKFFDDIYSDRIKSHLHPSVGNHEYMTDNAQPYLDYFHPPKMALNQADQGRYYSLDVKNVHLVSLDSNRPLDEAGADRSDDMVDWLEQDLAKVGADKKVIVFFHHPAFSDGPHGIDSRVQEKLVPVFDKYHVALVLNGHDHNYLRSCRINVALSRDACSESGTVYIVTGGGGASLYKNPDRHWFARASESRHNFVRVLVELDGKITVEAVGDDGQVFDQAEL